MVLVYKDMQISRLEDIQRLKVKDLRKIAQYKFGSDGQNKSRFGVESLRDTHATRATTG